MFKAILVDQHDGQSRAEYKSIANSELPAGDVTVRVSWSTLNYKDALAVTGAGPVLRSHPMIPGIDLAGVVEASEAPEYKPGDQVILSGWGVGESHWGGLSQRAKVNSAWLTPLPASLSLKRAMAIGTAGYTAMASIAALEKWGVSKSEGSVLVTGANGGVGSIAVMLLAKRGYRVVASTGRVEHKEHLLQLGAAEVIDRATLSAPGKPLQRERWAAAIDTVGSHTLVNVCAAMRGGGAVAACGMAQGLDLPASVAPFILRGISLLGIACVYRPLEERIAFWGRFPGELDLNVLDSLVQEIPLSEAISYSQRLLAGQVRGRLVVNANQ